MRMVCHWGGSHQGGLTRMVSHWGGLTRVVSPGWSVIGVVLTRVVSPGWSLIGVVSPGWSH